MIQNIYKETHQDMPQSMTVNKEKQIIYKIKSFSYTNPMAYCQSQVNQEHLYLFKIK